ncbi:MAG: anthranilate phosphoribosyltransferase [Gammaproteobacteria bacterium]|nr:anthranilate phosphoribosyltransferase [Gammaproteobacteria bacterium]
MKQRVETLFSGEDLSYEDARLLFKQVFSDTMEHVTIAGILIALKVKGETPTEIAALVQTLRDNAVKFPSPKGLSADSCGTGGDGLYTLNVSTASAFVAAECGLPMVKHGNRSVSSRSGSADIIEALGIDLNASPEKSSGCLQSHGYSFLFAPRYHPSMASVAPVRQKLATRSIFNLAGPLANPAAPPVQLMGVYHQDLCQTLAEALSKLGCENALVVHGSGLDEIALHGDTHAVLLRDGKTEQMTIKPSDAGLETQHLKAIQLSESDDPLAVFLEVIKGRGSVAMTDIVALNTGALLWTAGLYDSIKEATTIAKQAILDGAVANKLADIQDYYQ